MKTRHNTTQHYRRSNARRKRLMNSREAGKIGHRYYAFYRGHRARRAGTTENPYNPDTADHAAWDAGRKYAEMQETEMENYATTEANP